MPREYCLICATCKEFLDLHKFKLAAHICDQSPLGINGASISSLEITEGIKQVEASNGNNHWIYRLIPEIKSFSMNHAAHDLRLVDDCEPDYLWWPEHTRYTEWKEIPGPMSNELFLPRNLVADLKITAWEQAENYLKASGVILYEELELNEYKAKFDQLIKSIVL